MKGQSMRAVLDHVGIAVADLPAALAFYRDALGLDIEMSEDVSSQRVRAHFVPVGEASLELLEATAPDSPIAKFVDKHGPGLHHITLRVEDVEGAVAHLEARGIRMIDRTPRPGAEGATIAFVHPSAAHGVLVELKQAATPYTAHHGHGGDMKTDIGIIGGSGLYDMAELTNREERHISTPFGDPSGPYLVGQLRGRRVAFLARHGVGHRILPSELNFRANIFGFKALGVERIISASAVGSLKNEYRPLDIVLPDQFFDRATSRASTFFGRGLVAHVAFAHPTCPDLSRVAAAAAEAMVSGGAKVHRGGTYVNIQGPQFSTLAESKLYRSWGFDVIGMTNLHEAKLAREAEICYTTLALVTDYDCWHPDHDSVTADLIIANLVQNAQTAQKTIAETVSRLGAARTCSCKDALASAIVTRPENIPEQTRRDLAPIIGRYVK